MDFPMINPNNNNNSSSGSSGSSKSNHNKNHPPTETYRTPLIQPDGPLAPLPEFTPGVEQKHEQSVIVSQIPPDADVPTDPSPPYESVTNYRRYRDKEGLRKCVMCGSKPGLQQCTIPRQNKDVCRTCDRSIWRHKETGIFFKWCKGCKKFLNIRDFGDKVDAAKCGKCRERGRQSYMLKKYKMVPVARNPATGLVTISSKSNLKSAAYDSKSAMKNGALDESVKVESGNRLPSILARTAPAMITVVKSKAKRHSISNQEDFTDKDDHSNSSHSSNSAEEYFGQISENSENTNRNNGSIAFPRPVISRKDSKVDVYVHNPNQKRRHYQERDFDKSTIARPLSTTLGKPLKAISDSENEEPAEEGSHAGKENKDREPQQDSLSSPSVKASKAGKGRKNVVEGSDKTTKSKRSKEESPSKPSNNGDNLGRLYELALVHDRIRNLEQRAELADNLKSKLDSQVGITSKYETELDMLKNELSRARERENTLHRTIESLQMHCHVLAKKEEEARRRNSSMHLQIEEMSRSMAAMPPTFDLYKRRKISSFPTTTAATPLNG